MRKLVVAVVLLWTPMVSAEVPTRFVTPISKVATSSSVATDTALWTPASGHSIAVMGCAVSSGAAQQTRLEFSNVLILPPIYTAADANYQTQSGAFPIAVGAADVALAYSTTSTTTTTITCWGYEYTK